MPLTAAPITGQAVTFARLRRMLAQHRESPGAVGASSLAVTQRATGGAAMFVDVAPGDYWVRVATGPDQPGLVHVRNDAVFTRSIGAADGSLPRIDQVLLRHNDAGISLGDGSSAPTIYVAQGTPTAGATLANRAGAVADGSLPAGTERIADVLVPAGATSIVNANILDRRRWALPPEVATGDYKYTTSSAAPAGWLLCDGSAVSRTQYADLFALIGTTFGTGDGSTTFGLPDLRGRVPVMPDGTAGRLDASDALGDSGGAQKHTLTTAEMPAHSHPAPNASTSYWTRKNAGGFYVNAGTPGPGQEPLSQDPTGNASTAPVGDGSAHNNMQPFQVGGYWFIRS